MRAPAEVQPLRATPHSQKVKPEVKGLSAPFASPLALPRVLQHMNLQVVSPCGRYLVWTLAKPGAGPRYLELLNTKFGPLGICLPSHVMSTFTV